MRQPHPTLIDTCPLSAMWERPVEPRAEEPQTSAPIEPQPKPKDRPNCLHCGKQTTGRIFCDNKCKERFNAGMRAFSRRLERTKLVGETQTLELGE